MTKNECFLCGSPCNVTGCRSSRGSRSLFSRYTCLDCGEYVVSERLKADKGRFDDCTRFRMACVLRERTNKREGGVYGILADGPPPVQNTIDCRVDRWWGVSEILQEFPEGREVFDRALLNLWELMEHRVGNIDLPWEDWSYVLFCPPGHITDQIDLMKEKGFVRDRGSTLERGVFGIGAKGWDRVDELHQKGYDSANASASTHENEEQAMEPDDPKAKVFVVHGRDKGPLHEVCILLGHLGLSPVVLSEQTDEGQTIIEKFERHAEVGYAVVLLTPDDEGKLRDAPILKPRARQNVIFELGFFYGKLGRQKVCALLKEGCEFPSDIHGVLYKSADPAGAWKLQLAREIKAGGLPVDLNKLR